MSEGLRNDREKLLTYDTLDSFLEPTVEPAPIPLGDVRDPFERDEIATRARRSSTASNISDFGRELAPKEQPPMQIGYNILFLLFILGITTGVVNGCTLWAGKMISLSQAELIQSNVAGPLFFMMTTAAYAAASAYIIKKGDKAATIGSGMPEVKSLLLNDLHRSDFPNIVSFKILCVRLFSLVTGVGSGLSIGIAAPLVHVAICTAYTLMNIIPDFGEFLENHAIRKQVFTAAAAVGMTTVFNAPVGGLLLSLELTNTFYLVSNYWRSFMAATTGAVMYSIFLLAKSDKGRIFQLDYIVDPFLTWEFVMYALLGVICGLLGLQFLKLHQAFSLFIKPYTQKYPIGLAAAVGAFTALMIFAVGAYSPRGVSEAVIVYDLFQDAHISEESSRKVDPIGALFAALLVRVVLTLLGTTQRISCGVFLPVLTLGAYLGRIYGEILATIFPNSINIYVSGYAMVGAVAFISGTTHTLSVAVIVIEQTGQFSMLLPCLVGAVIACGITKSRSLSLYDQGMINKGLESFDLLLKESGGFKYAADVLDDKVNSVHAKCTVGELFELLGPTLKQSTFPVTSSARSYRLVGCVDRRDVFNYLKAVFDREGLYAYVRHRLPADAHYDDRRLMRQKQIAQRQALFSGESLEHSVQGMFKTEYDDEGRPVSKLKGWFGMLNRPSHSVELDDDIVSDEEGSTHSDDSGFGEHDKTRPQATHKRAPAVENPLLAASAPSSPLPPHSPGADTPREGNQTPRSSAPTSPTGLLRPPTVQHLTDGLKENFRTLQHRVAQLPAEIGLPVPVDPNSPKSVHFSAAQQAKIQALLDKSLNVTQEPQLSLNSFPFTAHRYTTMDQLYVLFEMVKVHVVFVVTNTKRLEGMITKYQLMQHLKEKVK
jgi:H+/Cl- antiporter ClcA